MGRVPKHHRSGRVRTVILVRAVVLFAVPAVVLTACSTAKPQASHSPAASPASGSASSAVTVPTGVTLTQPGSKLHFGDSARVAFEPKQGTGTVLKLTVQSARHASRRDFKNFILDDPYKRRARYYYVHVRVANLGTTNVGGNGIPLWGVDGHNTLLPAVSFTTRFKPCASKPLPKRFGPGDTLKTCLVYLSPRHGSLTAVSFRPDQAFNPIVWTGTVAPAAKPTHHHKHKHQHRHHKRRHHR